VSIELHGQGGSSGLQPLQAANDDAFARSQVTRVINQSVLTFDQVLTSVFGTHQGSQQTTTGKVCLFMGFDINHF
jgi:hypothetical protein